MKCTLLHALCTVEASKQFAPDSFLACRSKGVVKCELLAPEEGRCVGCRKQQIPTMDFPVIDRAAAQTADASHIHEHGVAFDFHTLFVGVDRAEKYSADIKDISLAWPQ